MPHAFGYRARTRHLHSKPFRRHGTMALSKRMVNYKVGDYVDIITDGSVHKGMPYRIYHGKTGRVFDVKANALGVIINKTVRTRIMAKRLHVRIEHVRASRTREAFVERIVQNDRKKAEAKKEGKKISTKRQPGQPREGYFVEGTSAQHEFLHPLKHTEIY